MSADALRLWTDLLDGFDSDLASAARGEDAPSWRQPVDFPPLPAELAQRARGILRRQLAAVEKATESMDVLRAEISAARGPRQTRLQSAPVYLDRLG